MSDTIKAIEGYRIKFCINKSGERNGFVQIWDGERFLFKAKERTLEDYNDEKSSNECFVKREVFTTRKGNQYVYWGDLETFEDYVTLIKKSAV